LSRLARAGFGGTVPLVWEMKFQPLPFAFLEFNPVPRYIRNSISFVAFNWQSQKPNCDDRCILDSAFGTYHELTKPSRGLGGKTEFRN